jgi:hypothetical protein
LSIPDVPFPALLSTLFRRQFQVKPATLLIPVELVLFLFTGGVVWYLAEIEQARCTLGCPEFQ